MRIFLMEIATTSRMQDSSILSLYISFPITICQLLQKINWFDDYNRTIISWQGLCHLKCLSKFWALRFSFSYVLVVQKILSPGEALTVDAACIVAMTSTINFQLKYSDPTRRVIFGVSFCVFLLNLDVVSWDSCFVSCNICSEILQAR